MNQNCLVTFPLSRAGDGSSLQLLNTSLCKTLTAVFNIPLILLSALAVAANWFNLVVFWNLRLSTTTSICFFTLSAADFLSAAIMIVTGLSTFQALNSEEMTVTTGDVQILVTPLTYSSLAFSAWVTTIISVERCVCIARPLQVKRIFNKKSVRCLLLAGLLYQVMASIPNLWTMRMAEVTSRKTNRTKFVFDHGFYDERMGLVSLFAAFSLPTMVCFTIVLVSTIILVVKLRQSYQFRSSTRGRQNDFGSAKEARIARVVMLICTVFIVCFLPTVSAFLVSVLVPSFHVSDPYLGNLAFLIVGIAAITPVLSSFLNTFIYFSANSSFRAAAKSLLSIKEL